MRTSSIKNPLNSSSTSTSSDDDSAFSTMTLKMSNKKKWNPFKVFIRKQRLGAKYPDSNDSITPVCNGCRSGDQDTHSSEDTSSLTLEDGSSKQQERTDPESEEISFRPSIFDGVFDQQTVYDYVWEYHAAFSKALELEDPLKNPAWRSFWIDHHTADFVFIRPSGNPLSLQGLMDQLSKGEITNYEEDVITVDSIKIFGEVAVIVYRSQTNFYFKGDLVEDIRTNTIVIVWQDGKPKITNIQRSSGRPTN